MTDLKVAAKRALQLMDLTTLNEDDTDEKVIALCHQQKAQLVTPQQFASIHVSSQLRVKLCASRALLKFISLP